MGVEYVGEGWVSLWRLGGEHHVMPLGDYRPHIMACSCWCRPDEDAAPGSLVWVHHALDRREQIEDGSIRLS